MNKKVIILGGGVAGLSAAHELIERNFDVEVYELLAIPGGKARSMEVSNPPPPWHSNSISKSNGGEKRPLPGEHGFRFFPGFYNHIIDTMKRIPYENNKKGVLRPRFWYYFIEFLILRLWVWIRKLWLKL